MAHVAGTKPVARREDKIAREIIADANGKLFGKSRDDLLRAAFAQMLAGGTDLVDEVWLTLAVQAAARLPLRSGEGPLSHEEMQDAAKLVRRFFYGETLRVARQRYGELLGAGAQQRLQVSPLGEVGAAAAELLVAVSRAEALAGVETAVDAVVQALRKHAPELCPDLTVTEPAPALG